MDFSSRDVPRQPSAANVAPSSAVNNGGGSASHHNSRKSRGDRDRAKWLRIATVAAVVVIAILIAAVITVIVSGSNDVKAESNYVDTNKLQAVFLNTGQVYFGHVQSLNDKYFVLNDIYYLQTSNGSTSSTSKSASSVTLVKLGCELHRPYDQMVINSDQVTFWENLQSDGQVATAVANFQKDNPDGLKCTDQSNSASNSSINSAQNAGSSSNTPSTSTPATTPAKH